MSGETPSLTIQGSEVQHEISSLSREQKFILKGIALEMFTSLEPDEVINIAVKRICQALDGIGCSIWTIDLQSNELVCRGVTGIQSNFIRNKRIPIYTAIVSKSDPLVIPRILEFRPDAEVIIESSSRDIAFPIYFMQVGVMNPSVYSIPLQTKETSLGILQLLVNSPYPLKNEEYATLEILTNLAALALRNAQLYQEAIQSSQADQIELRGRIDTLQDFIRIVAHDLKSPLTNIMGNAYFLLNELGKLSQRAEFIDLAHDILSDTKRLCNLLDRLHEYALSERKIPFEQIDCNEVVQQVVSDLQITIKDRNAQVNFQSLPTILGDRTLIKIVLQNLISNGIKYCEKQPTINVAATVREHDVLFSVMDNGIGIPKDQAERIFRPFERGKNVIDYEGAGLGLAICQRIIEHHKGRIWVDSKVGQGSTFFFTIPRRG
jgi:signal transduction histidine kinase